MRRSVAALLLAASVVLPAKASGTPAEMPIQPGAPMVAPAGCTLAFVFSGEGGALYISTAGHCVGEAGTRVAVPEGEIGTVVYRSFDAARFVDDFALVRVDGDRRSQVSPAVRHWGGPNGYSTSADAAAGDLILEYGWGLGFGETPVTRPRTGILVLHNNHRWRGEIATLFGDSGAPVLHHTGRALGLVTGFLNYSMLGTTVERGIALAAAAGIDVKLVTSP